MVNTDGNGVCLIKQNVARHKHGVGEKTGVYIVGVLCGFILELSHAGKLAELCGTAQNPVSFRMGGNMALDEKNTLLRVDSASHCKGIGFNRAARIMDQLADAGVVGEEEGTKPRKILMSPEQFEQYVEETL